MIEQLFRKAYEAYKEAEYEEALALLDKILAQGTSFANACYLKGLISDEDDLRLECFNKAIALDATVPEFWVGRARYFLHQLEDETEGAHKCIADCDVVIEKLRHPIELADAHELKAMALKRLGQWNDAVENFVEAATRNNQKFPFCIARITEIFTDEFQDYEKALSYWNEYITFFTGSNSEELLKKDITEPDRAVAYYLRGVLKMEHLNKAQDGLKDLETAFVMDPDGYREDYMAYQNKFAEQLKAEKAIQAQGKPLSIKKLISRPGSWKVSPKNSLIFMEHILEAVQPDGLPDFHAKEQEHAQRLFDKLDGVSFAFDKFMNFFQQHYNDRYEQMLTLAHYRYQVNEEDGLILIYPDLAFDKPVLTMHALVCTETQLGVYIEQEDIHAFCEFSEDISTLPEAYVQGGADRDEFDLD